MMVFRFADNTFKTIKDLLDAFTEKWGDKKEHCHLLAALNTIKKNENETMEEFNKRFNELINSLHKDIKPSGCLHSHLLHRSLQWGNVLSTQG
jgi:predicted transcriptional regulator